MSLIMTFSIAAFISRNHEPQQSMNEAQRYALQQQQKIFIIWYTDYQKDIDNLDRNWQLYHNIVESFINNNIDIETAYERLSDLESEARIEQLHIYTLKVPPGLGEECNNALEEIIRKTQKYADEQTQTISLTKNAINPEQSLNDNHNEQVKILQNIMIRESPTGLFTANELSAILNYFTLPEDFQNKEIEAKP